MDPSLTGFYMVGQKLSDVIPVLRITFTATEPSTVSVFLSVVKCGRVCRHTPAHIMALSHPGLPRGFHKMGQKNEKIEFLTISKIYVPISLQPL